LIDINFHGWRWQKYLFIYDYHNDLTLSQVLQGKGKKWKEKGRKDDGMDG
jgi:hypothetical protein